MLEFHCKAGLADHDNYHAFCRLLGRFKVNYQVSHMLFLIHMLYLIVDITFVFCDHHYTIRSRLDLRK